MPKFVGPREAASLIGYSYHSLKKLRRNNLQNGIHFVVLGPRKIVYNAGLLIDWIANFNDPELHEIAVQNYLRSLPSSQPTIKSRAKCAA
jgi:hypothetical protein